MLLSVVKALICCLFPLGGGHRHLWFHHPVKLYVSVTEQNVRINYCDFFHTLLWCPFYEQILFFVSNSKFYFIWLSHTEPPLLLSKGGEKIQAQNCLFF